MSTSPVRSPWLSMPGACDIRMERISRQSSVVMSGSEVTCWGLQHSLTPGRTVVVRAVAALTAVHLVDSQHMRVAEQHVLLSDLSGQAVLPQ
jgi:hypothetical protein